MNKPSKLSPYGVGMIVLFFSWFFFPVVIASVGWLTHPMELFNSVMGGVYQAYIVGALYFAGFSTLSVVKYQHPHWVRILFALGMLMWCFAVHYLVLLNIDSC